MVSGLLSGLLPALRAPLDSYKGGLESVPRVSRGKSNIIVSDWANFTGSWDTCRPKSVQCVRDDQNHGQIFIP